METPSEAVSSRPATSAAYSPGWSWDAPGWRNQGVKLTLGSTAEKLGFHVDYKPGPAHPGKQTTGAGYLTYGSNALMPSTLRARGRTGRVVPGMLTPEDKERLDEVSAQGDEAWKAWLMTKTLPAKQNKVEMRRQAIVEAIQKEKEVQKQSMNSFHVWLQRKTSQQAQARHQLQQQAAAMYMYRTNARLRDALAAAQAAELEQRFSLRPTTTGMSLPPISPASTSMRASTVPASPGSTFSQSHRRRPGTLKDRKPPHAAYVPPQDNDEGIAPCCSTAHHQHSPSVRPPQQAKISPAASTISSTAVPATTQGDSPLQDESSQTPRSESPAPVVVVPVTAAGAVVATTSRSSELADTQPILGVEVSLVTGTIAQQQHSAAETTSPESLLDASQQEVTASEQLPAEPQESQTDSLVNALAPEAPSKPGEQPSSTQVVDAEVVGAASVEHNAVEETEQYVKQPTEGPEAGDAGPSPLAEMHDSGKAATNPASQDVGAPEPSSTEFVEQTELKPDALTRESVVSPGAEPAAGERGEPGVVQHESPQGEGTPVSNESAATCERSSAANVEVSDDGPGEQSEPADPADMQNNGTAVEKAEQAPALEEGVQEDVPELASSAVRDSRHKAERFEKVVAVGDDQQPEPLTPAAQDEGQDGVAPTAQPECHPTSHDGDESGTQQPEQSSAKEDNPHASDESRTQQPEQSSAKEDNPHGEQEIMDVLDDKGLPSRPEPVNQTEAQEQPLTFEQGGQEDGLKQQGSPLVEPLEVGLSINSESVHTGSEQDQEQEPPRTFSASDQDEGRHQEQPDAQMSAPSQDETPHVDSPEPQPAEQIEHSALAGSPDRTGLAEEAEQPPAEEEHGILDVCEQLKDDAAPVTEQDGSDHVHVEEAVSSVHFRVDSLANLPDELPPSSPPEDQQDTSNQDEELPAPGEARTGDGEVEEQGGPQEAVEGVQVHGATRHPAASEDADGQPE